MVPKTHKENAIGLECYGDLGPFPCQKCIFISGLECHFISAYTRETFTSNIIRPFFYFLEVSNPIPFEVERL